MDVWGFIKGFLGKGSTQIGKGNRSQTVSSTGANSPVYVAGRDVHLVMPGNGVPAAKTEQEELRDWLRANTFREPLSQVLPQVIRLAMLLENKDIERWA